MTLQISCQHNGSEVARSLSDLAGRIDRVPEEAMPQVVAALKEDATAEIERIAHGVYWDVESEISASEGRATGRVWTDRSKPHRIEPTKPHGLLVFEAGGETVFVWGGINHPGSRPVDWIPGVSRSERTRGAFRGGMERAISGGLQKAAPTGGL